METLRIKVRLSDGTAPWEPPKLPFGVDSGFIVIVSEIQGLLKILQFKGFYSCGICRRHSKPRPCVDVADTMHMGYFRKL
jgi:hypothetical protein